MKFEDLPEMVRKTVDFEESVTTESKRKCPKCGKETVERRIYQDRNWYVENCEEKDCPYWNCGMII